MTSMTSRLRSAATLAAASALLAAFTTPAGAKDTAVNEPAKAAATTGASASVAPAAEKKYCIKDTITGSRQTKTFCKTKEQWAAEGVEIPSEK